MEVRRIKGPVGENVRLPRSDQRCSTRRDHAGVVPLEPLGTTMNTSTRAGAAVAELHVEWSAPVGSKKVPPA
jgi:hypothetical protein